MLLVGLAGAGLLVVGFGLTPLSGSVLGSMLGLGPKGDFSLSPSSSYISVPQGSTGSISLVISSQNHFGGGVSLTATITTRSSTPAIAISQPSVSIGPDAIGSVSLSISTTTSTTIGYYNVTAQGSAGTVSHSAIISVQVTPPPPPPTPDFYISTTPSWLTISQGTSVNATVTVSSVLSYSGNIALTATIDPIGTNSPKIALVRSSLVLPPGGSNITTLMVSSFNATAGSYGITIFGTSGSLSHSIQVSLQVSVGTEGLLLEFYGFSSSTNATLAIRNIGSATTRLVAYYVTDSLGDQYSLVGWNGPAFAPNQLKAAIILIGASCAGCVLSGSPFTFTTGNSYTITLVTSYNHLFAFTVSLANRESLSMDAYAFSNSTNAVLYIRNTGTLPVQLVSYVVKDSSGDSYTLSSYPGPTIPVNGVAATFIKIGSACPGCTLSGSPFVFTVGYSYTVTFMTAKNNPFTFVITR